jgi:sarcosine oxidase, subunit gamma
MSGAATGPIPGALVLEVGARYGVKGKRAANWLAQRGIGVPEDWNRVVHWSGSGGGRCLRLGNTEFLVEYDAANAMAPTPGGEDGAYLLLRSDFSLLLDPTWTHRLAQACSFDFERLRDDPEMVVMTLLAGISVTLVREPRPNDTGITLRLWCDASYTAYLQSTLHTLMRPA